MEEFPAGTRVELASMRRASICEDTSSSETALVELPSSSGTAVASYPEMLLVRRDGDYFDVLVPSRIRTVIARAPLFTSIKVKSELPAHGELKKTANKSQPHWGFAPNRKRETVDVEDEIDDTDFHPTLSDQPEARQKSKVKTRTKAQTKSSVNMGIQQKGVSKKKPKASWTSNDGFCRARTVKEALEAGGWTLLRDKNHVIYRRTISRFEDDDAEIKFTMAKNSDASKNALATLNKHNRDHHNPSEDAKTKNDFIVCLICQKQKKEDQFSKSQLRKETNKCKRCVAESENEVTYTSSALS